jgi:hypothetical protein
MNGIVLVIYQLNTFFSPLIKKQMIPVGILTATSSFSFLLDLYPGAAAAYSLRKLRTAYSGSAIRVQRSTDNAQTDIGFIADVLDITTLLTFCGVGNGFVRTWYDQSGNNNNAEINPSGPQAPKIVISGVLQTQNGKPCLRFFQTNNDQLLMTNAILADTNISIFMTAKGDNLVSNGPILGGNSGPPTVLFGYLSSLPNLAYQGLLNGTSNYINTVPNFANANFLIYQAIVNSTNYYLYQNNNTFTQTVIGLGISAPPSFNRIGAYFASNTNGIFSELIFYKTDQSANRTGIVNNTNSFYTIF